MKAFLEEYGLIVVVCIVIAVLIALAVWVSYKGKASTGRTVLNFTNKAEQTVQKGLGDPAYTDEENAKPNSGKDEDINKFITDEQDKANNANNGGSTEGDGSNP